jgi:alditol oxidase
VIDAAGFALFNLPSVPDFTVVGAVSTATHGSGDANRNLAASVAGLEIVTASGDLLKLDRGDADFEGAVIGLGALGVVVAMTLDLVPRFDIRQTVYRNLPFETVVENFDAVMGAAYSVSLFTHWNSEFVDQCWTKALATDPAPQPEFFGGKAAEAAVSPVVGRVPDGTTGQLGTVGKWYEMLPHFRIGAIPLEGYEYQSEYFVARRDAPAAMRALKAVQAGLHPALVVSEIRTIAEDRLWLSTNLGADSVGFHFSMSRDWAVVQQALAVIEGALAPFNPRPHWGKLFVMPAQAVRASHPRLNDFQALASRLDPAGKFRNAFLDAFVFGG